MAKVQKRTRLGPGPPATTRRARSPHGRAWGNIRTAFEDACARPRSTSAGSTTSASRARAGW